MPDLAPVIITFQASRELDRYLRRAARNATRTRGLRISKSGILRELALEAKTSGRFLPVAAAPRRRRAA